ncbi:unnamed protein product [marine sediment metagenome]|uniref:Glycosyl hydrolase family 88 n=1 Tax=marine sediment metagenome TaxID=412755 RepID=X0Z3E1_9ZZZZ
MQLLEFQLFQFVEKWINQSVETQTSEGELSGGDPSQTNFALIGLSVLYFAENERKSKLFSDAIQKQANYLLQTSLKRTDRGGLYYMKMLPQIWVDTVIMICPFLAKAGKFLKKSKYTEEAINQLNIHREYLKDPETGLYRHIWDDKGKKFYEGSLWGRGNGWMITSLVEVMEQLPKKHPQRNELITEINITIKKNKERFRLH